MNAINTVTNVQDLAHIKSDTSIKNETLRKSPKNSFSDTIKEFLTAVNNDQQTAASKVQEIVTGQSQNLTEAMAALEESRLSFQLMLEIRNKLVESYQEINRMQI
jgi:flagellar hook-basal body complex protein FliE